MGNFYKSTLLILFYLACLVHSEDNNNPTLKCPSSIDSETELVEMEPECFRKLYNTELHDGHKIYKVINERLATYKRLLQDLKMNDVQHLRTHPVIKWAQNQSHIFLNMRLSHRHDSPTCSDIRSQNFGSDVFFVSGDLNIERLQSQHLNQNYQTPKQQSVEQNHTDTTNNSSQTTDPPVSIIKSRFNLQCECYFTNQKLLFSLHLKFNGTLIRLNIKRQGFGTYTLIGQKLNPEIWIYPFNDVKKAGIWSQMRNKYQKDMNNYFSLLQSATENTPSKVKRKYRNKAKKQQAQQNVQTISNGDRTQNQEL